MQREAGNRLLMHGLIFFICSLFPRFIISKGSVSKNKDFAKLSFIFINAIMGKTKKKTMRAGLRRLAYAAKEKGEIIK